MADQDKKPAQDPLFGNKLAAALLTAGLLAVSLPQLSAALFAGGAHGGGHGGGHGEALHLAYPIEFQAEGAAAAEAVPEVSLAALLAAASPAAGERRAAICKSCHSFEQGGPNGAGPNLWSVVGRPVASASGFNYSSALQGAGGTWTYDRLDAYLKNSQEYVPGTNMNQRFPKAEQRAELLAYLQTLSAEPVPFPAAPVEEAAVAAEAEPEAAH